MVASCCARAERRDLALRSRARALIHPSVMIDRRAQLLLPWLVAGRSNCADYDEVLRVLTADRALRVLTADPPRPPPSFGDCGRDFSCRVGVPSIHIQHTPTDLGNAQDRQIRTPPAKPELPSN